MAPLITDVGTLRAAVERGEVFSYRFFWKPLVAADGRLTDGCLGQWWMSDFALDGVTYSSAEQWMMASEARLFGDRAVLEEILAARDPSAVQKLGKRVRNFDEATWRARCLDVVTDGNVAKFSQDAALRAHLLGTGDAVLVEASPLDRIWGIGLAADQRDRAGASARRAGGGRRAPSRRRALGCRTARVVGTVSRRGRDSVSGGEARSDPDAVDAFRRTTVGAAARRRCYASSVALPAVRARSSSS